MALGPKRLAGRAALALLRPFARRKLPPQPEAPVGRIVVFRFGGIGDCIALTALLRSLKQCYPAAHLALVTAPAVRPVFEANRDVDAIIVSESLRATADPVKLWRNIRSLRRLSRPGWDIAVFAHNPFEDLALAPFLHARFKVGFETNDRGFAFGMTHAAPITDYDHPAGGERQRNTHLVEHFHALLRAFRGDDAPPAPMRLVITAAEARSARDWLADNGLGGPLVVLAPGGTQALKLWPVGRFAELARRVVAELGASVVVVGGAEEAVHAALFAGLGPCVRFAAGALSLRQSFALLGAASALVASDTGLAHAGAALDIPLVTIFGPTPHRVYGYEGEGRVVLKAGLPCVPCAAATCRLLPAGARSAVPPCLDAIGVGDVLAALRGVLTGAPRAEAAP